VRRLTVSVYLLTLGTGLNFLEPATLRGEPQETTRPRLTRNFIASDSTSAGRNSGPALTRRERELVPPPPPLARPPRSPVLGHQRAHQKKSRKMAATKPRKTGRNVSAVATHRRTPAARKPARIVVPNRTWPAGIKSRPIPATNRAGVAEARHVAVVPVAMLKVEPVTVAPVAPVAKPATIDTAPDPEALRIRDELKRLHDDAEARRAFYDDLQRTVEQVRAGIRSQGSMERNVSFSRETNITLPGPSSPSYRQTPSQPSNPNLSSAPRASESTRPETPQASLDIHRDGIDPASYRLVVHWAKVNGTPVELALGVAWMESHLRQNPPRGGAGEVGMFQIMPERCVTEGWPAERLNDPEFNARLGTLLLARYYQEEGSVARAAAKYVAGPGVFDKHYSSDVWAYINWYASTIESYANYFSRYQG